MSKSVIIFVVVNLDYRTCCATYLVWVVLIECNNANSLTLNSFFTVAQVSVIVLKFFATDTSS